MVAILYQPQFFLRFYEIFLSPILLCWSFCQTSNISGTLVGNKIVDHSNVVGASPVCTASTTFSFST